MAVVHRDGKALRCHQLAPASFRGIVGVVMQAVGVMHPLRPAADIVVGDRLHHAGRLHGFAQILVDIRTIEIGHRHVVHGLAPLVTLRLGEVACA